MNKRRVQNILKQNKAITLIALVITIIVLLILAGVTIAAISGNESIMEKGTESKQKSKEADELDSIKMAVVEAMAQGIDGKVNLENLQASLRNIPNIVSEEDVDALSGKGQWTVTGIDTGMKYTITNTGKVVTKVGEINEKIGNTVQYSVTPTGSSTPIVDWQVFYADAENEEVFIISKDILELNTAVGGTDTTSNAYPDGAAEESLAEGTYGRNYNSQWLSIEGAGLMGKKVSVNAKITAYLCDNENENWKKYAGGTFGTGTSAVAASTNVYAVGGPTIELLQKSVREFDITKLNGDFIITSVGYNVPFNFLIEPYKAKYDGINYGLWWIASPSKSIYLDEIIVNGAICQAGGYAACGNKYGVRPLVSIPLSEFQTSWINL